MKKYFSLLLLTQLLLINSTVGQQIKTYKGDYMRGAATYSYYENQDFERVFHGNFTYILPDYYGETSIKGKYIDNIKNGIWVYKYSYLSMGEEGNVTKTLTVNYKNGKLNGKCSYITQDLNNNKKIVAKSTVQYINGKLAGDFSSWSSKSKLVFELNKNGFIDGSYLNTYRNYNGVKLEDRRKYFNGLLYWQLRRNLETGEILDKLDIENQVLKYLNNTDTTYGVFIIDKIKIRKDDVEYNHRSYGSNMNFDYLEFKNVPIIIITDLRNNIIDFWNDPANTMIKNINKNLIPDKNTPNAYITKKIVIPKNIKLSNLELFSTYKQTINTADSLFVHNSLIQAKTEYLIAISLLGDEFTKYPQEKINVINYKLYPQYIASADSLYQLKNYESALEDYKFANAAISTEYCNTQILVVSEIINKAKFDTLITKADASFTQNDFKIALSKYNSAYELIQNKYVLTQINKTKSKLSIIKADSLLQLEEIELALKAYKKSNKKFETGYAQQQIMVCNDIIAFNKSDYGKIRRDVKLELTKWLVKAKYESETDYETRVKKNIDTQLQSIIQQKVKFYKFKFDKQLNKMLTGKIKNYESKSETLKIGAYVNSLNLQVPAALANRIIDGLSGYKVHGCGKYGCIKVVFNDILLVDNNYTLSDATVLFFLNGREYDLYQDIFDGGFEISSTKKGLKIRPNWTKKDIKFNNIEGSKTNGIFLYYDWKLATQTNFDATKIQKIDITLENLDIELPF